MVRWAVACIGMAVVMTASACPNAPAEATSGIGEPWTDGHFVYEFSPEVVADPARVAAFEAACDRLLNSTALKCTARSLAPQTSDYVFVIDTGRDFSLIGRHGGCQPLSIATWSNPIVIAHEIKHALGWAHEQQHPGRDRYIDVDFESIEPAHRAEFEIRDLGNEGPYDPDSMMHFYPADFARPGQLAFRLRAGATGNAAQVGQRNHFSETDLAEIRAVYGAAE